MVFQSKSKVSIKNEMKVDHISRCDDIQPIWDKVRVVPMVDDILNRGIRKDKLTRFKDLVSVPRRSVQESTSSYHTSQDNAPSVNQKP